MFFSPLFQIQPNDSFLHRICWGRYPRVALQGPRAPYSSQDSRIEWKRQDRALMVFLGGGGVMTHSGQRTIRRNGCRRHLGKSLFREMPRDLPSLKATLPSLCCPGYLLLPALKRGWHARGCGRRTGHWRDQPKDEGWLRRTGKTYVLKDTAEMLSQLRNSQFQTISKTYSLGDC